MLDPDPSDLEDLERVRRFQDGDRSGFEALFDKYREKVFAVAFRFVRNKEDALEVTQEAFIRAYQGLPQFKHDSKFFTWLYRITVNKAIDHLRARRIRRTVEMPRGEDGETLAIFADPNSPDPEAVFDRKEAVQELWAALRSLSEKHRAVFLLHAVEQLSYKEIAEVLGCNIGTVMSRLFYARKKLQDLLGQKGIV